MTPGLSPLTPRPHPDVVARRVGTGAVLVHLSTGAVFELNETGIRVWELVAAGEPADAIAGMLVDEYQADAAVAGREVDDLLTELEAKGLLVR